MTLGMKATLLFRPEDAFPFIHDLVYRYTPAIVSLHGESSPANRFAASVLEFLEERNRHTLVCPLYDLKIGPAALYLVTAREPPTESNQLILNHFKQQPHARLFIAERKKLEETLQREKFDLSKGAYSAVVVVEGTR